MHIKLEAKEKAELHLFCNTVQLKARTTPAKASANALAPSWESELQC